MEQTIKENYLYDNFHKLFRHSNININTNILQTNSTDKFGSNVGLVNSLVRGTGQFEEPKKSTTTNLFQIFNSGISSESIKNNLENLIIDLTTIKKNEDIVKKITSYLETINPQDTIQQKISIILKEVLDNSNNVLFFRYNIITYNEYAIDKLLECMSLFTNTYIDQKKVFDKNIELLTNIFYKLKQTFISFNKTSGLELIIKKEPIEEEQIYEEPIIEEQIDDKNVTDKLLKSTKIIQNAAKIVEDAHNKGPLLGGNITYKLDYIKECIRYKISLIKPKQPLY
jgi:hypothetical protein